jgi:hypothetical protein
MQIALGAMCTLVFRAAALHTIYELEGRQRKVRRSRVVPPAR